MFTFFINIINIFTNFENEFILNSSKLDVIMKKYRAYIQQQHARMKALQRAFVFSIVQIFAFKKKSFYIKIMKNKSKLFVENSYKE